VAAFPRPTALWRGAPRAAWPRHPGERAFPGVTLHRARTPLTSEKNGSEIMMRKD
jgi:hypothetical protein